MQNRTPAIVAGLLAAAAAFWLWWPGPPASEPPDLTTIPLILRGVAALLVVTVLALGPGAFLTRRLDWRPLERLTVAVAISLTLVFLIGFGAYWAGQATWVGIPVLGVSVFMFAAAWRDTRALIRADDCRRALTGLLGLLLWNILLLAVIGQYGGGDSCCDWLEHYDRARNVLHPLPIGSLYSKLYPLSARPPLMNVETAVVLSVVGPTFALYQIVMLLLNSLGFLACCLLGRVLAGWRAFDERLLALAFAINPVFFVSVTVTWTKLLTAFFVILALALYVEALRKSDGLRLRAAALSFAAAILTHYSAAPVGIVVGLHFLFSRWAAPLRTWRQVTLALVPAALLISVWVVYIVGHFGLGAGLIHNPSLEGTLPTSWADHLQTDLLNLRDTFVPHPYLGYEGYPPDATWLRRTLDSLFTWFQGNAVLSMGVLNGVLAIVLAIRCARRGWANPESRFWVTLVGLAWPLGVLVHGDRNPMGVAHITLQPITYVGLTFVVTRVRYWARAMRALWVAGLACDLVLGVAAPTWFGMARGEWARTPNWDLKADRGLRFFADYWSPAYVLVALAVLVLLIGWTFVRPLVAQPWHVLERL